MHPWTQPILDSLRGRLERLPHALLVHGPRGVGKLALAERLAQLLLCEHSDAARRPCDACSACRWFSAGNHPDFRRIEPEAIAKAPQPVEGEEEEGSSKRKPPSIVIKIEQIRALDDFLNVGSHRGGRRVALLHPADQLQLPGAANALLKGLEEPPGSAVFILVSHQPALLLPTIRSRCVKVPVPVPGKADALKWLKAQGLEQPERWLAFAGGAPLRAIEYAAESESLTRLLNKPAPTDAKEDLERLVEVLQKIALDRSLAAFGLPPKYQTGSGKVSAGKAREWLAFARQIAQDRLLARHPLNPRLFSTALLAGKPGEG